MGSRLKRSLKVLSEQAQGAMTCYRMKVTLTGTKPEVWRRVQVDGEFTLGQLHVFLQDVIGWKDEHLHKFTLNGEAFMDRIQARQSPTEVFEENLCLCFLKLKKGQTFTYEYDFGDGWVHEIVIEDIFQLEERDDYEMVLDGEGACPPEDCGGLKAYYKLVEAHGDASHKKHKEAVKVLGAKFDPAIWKDKKAQLG